MNLDICKKCNETCAFYFLKDDKNKHFIKPFYSKPLMMFSNIIIKHSNKTGKFNKIKSRIKNELEVNDLNLISANLSEECPYYIEHKLMEWNK